MIKVVTAPAAFPVTLTEAKEFARVDVTDTSQDGTINMLIAAMTQYAEETITGRAFVERTLELNAERFAHCFDLPFPPLIGVDSIKYTDADGVEQTVDAATYEVDTVSLPGKVRPVYGASWPSVGPGFNPVRIQYRAGYASPGSPPDPANNAYLPAPLRTWIAARIVTLYDQRGQIMDGRDVKIPRDFADGLLDSLLIGTRLF
jgi:uncharacterized phiE125 gp8 family phage protein